jgi:hypothetical protein
VEDAVMDPSESALLNGDVTADLNVFDLDVGVGEGAEPAGVELETRVLTFASHPARGREDDAVGEHLGEAVYVVGVEGVCPAILRGRCRRRTSRR